MLQKDRKPTRRKAAPKGAAAPATPAPAVPAAGAAPVAGTRPAAGAITAAPARPAADAATRTVPDAPARRPVSAEERAHMIAEAAYFRAQQRGFGTGDPVRDWAEAEAEIDAMLLHSR